MNTLINEELLNDCISPDGGLFKQRGLFLGWTPGDKEVILDGGFSSEMLRAIAHYMDSNPSPKTQTCTESLTCSVLPSRPIQIQTLFNPGDHNSGEHVQLHALCEDGSIWLQYSSSGKSNVPNDGLWYPVSHLTV